MNVREMLFELQDLGYKDFHKKLVPNVDENKIIGVRIPKLRALAKTLSDDSFEWDYYEEIMLHGFHIGYGKYSFDERLKMLSDFIPYIDNWAVCDCVCSTLKFVKKNEDEFFKFLSNYFYSGKEYDMRFSIVMLMTYYLNDEYIDFCLRYFSEIKSDYYYVNMAAAWALSAAFVKYPDMVTKIIKSGCLTDEIQNMTISKIKDSYRVEKSVKDCFNSFKR